MDGGREFCGDATKRLTSQSSAPGRRVRSPHFILHAPASRWSFWNKVDGRITRIIRGRGRSMNSSAPRSGTPTRMCATTLGTIPSTLRLRTSIPSCLPGSAGAPRCTGRSGCISYRRTFVSARSTASPRTGLSLTKICFRSSSRSNARSECPDYRAIRHSRRAVPSLSSAANGFGRTTRSARDGTHGLALVAGKQRHPIREVRELNPCVRRGVCLTGCPEGAKSTTDRSHWPLAQKAGARLVTEARVKEIETDASGLASALIYVDANGRDRRQRAKVIILCANGVGTPRLLLMSGGSRHPDGLANSSGLVGKRLMMHPFASILASYEDPLNFVARSFRPAGLFTGVLRDG